MKNKLIYRFVAIALCACSLFFVACKDEEDSKSNLTFAETSTLLIEQDTKARVFFNNLDYNYKSSSDYTALEEATSYIKTLGSNLSTQLGEYQKTIDAFSGELESSNTTITRTPTTIKIENKTQVFEINMDEEKKNLVIEFEEDKGHYVYEKLFR